MADVYDALPHPFSHVPAPGEPVDAVVIADAILPLVQTVHCVLDTFASTAEREELHNAYLAITLAVLAGHLKLAIDLLQRLDETEEAASED